MSLTSISWTCAIIEHNIRPTA